MLKLKHTEVIFHNPHMTLAEPRHETIFLASQNHVIKYFGLACLGPERT